MRVGIIQSNYIPWRGYFDFIQSVDVFVIYDTTQYSHGSWRNRNKIKTSIGLKWLTVPVKRGSAELPIEQVKISQSSILWYEQQRRIIYNALDKAEYFTDAIKIWEEAILAKDQFLSPLNIRLIKAICTYLGITTSILVSSDYPVSGEKSLRLIELIKILGGAIYLSGPSANDYLDKDAFSRAGISLEYKSYDYPSYPQLWGEFEGAVTVLDLIANCGPESYKYINSNTPDNLIIP
jgi:hypothetical protein